MHETGSIEPVLDFKGEVPTVLAQLYLSNAYSGSILLHGNHWGQTSMRAGSAYVTSASTLLPLLQPAGDLHLVTIDLLWIGSEGMRASWIKR